MQLTGTEALMGIEQGQPNKLPAPVPGLVRHVQQVGQRTIGYHVAFNLSIPNARCRAT